MQGNEKEGEIFDGILCTLDLIKTGDVTVEIIIGRCIVPIDFSGSDHLRLIAIHLKSMTLGACRSYECPNPNISSLFCISC